MERQAVNRVDDLHAAGGRPAAHLSRRAPGEDASLGRMRVNDVGLDLAEQSLQRAVKAPVAERADLAAHGRQHDHAVIARRRPRHQLALRPDRGPGDQRHLMPARSQGLAGQDRVLLRPAQDQTRDNVADSHEGIVVDRAARRQDLSSGARAPCWAPCPRLRGHERHN